MRSRELVSADEAPSVEDFPVVHVAMATLNGRRWLPAQVRSILNQEGVQVRLVVSDDGSTDGTREWLEELAERDPRVTLLRPRGGEPGVGANFLYALDALDVAPGEFAAFSDQDDLWKPGKLARQVALLEADGVDAVSSDVVAFKERPGEPAEKSVVHKATPQVAWDFVFESPGPGSTFLLTQPAWQVVVDEVRAGGSRGIWMHDWYAYALVRAAGLGWFIDDQPQVAYRQHEANELGEHRGAEAVRTRMDHLRSGKYREQFTLTAQSARRVGERAGRDEDWSAGLAELAALLEDRSFGSRARLFAMFRQIRRKPVQGLALAGAGLLGVW